MTQAAEGECCAQITLALPNFLTGALQPWRKVKKLAFGPPVRVPVTDNIGALTGGLRCHGAPSDSAGEGT